MKITGRYLPVPATGTVLVGMGTVWENSTCRLPVPNPRCNRRRRRYCSCHRRSPAPTYPHVLPRSPWPAPHLLTLALTCPSPAHDLGTRLCSFLLICARVGSCGLAWGGGWWWWWWWWWWWCGWYNNKEEEEVTQLVWGGGSGGGDAAGMSTSTAGVLSVGEDGNGAYQGTSLTSSDLPFLLLLLLLLRLSSCPANQPFSRCLWLREAAWRWLRMGAVGAVIANGVG